jgi:hypothetical protein
MSPPQITLTFPAHLKLQPVTIEVRHKAHWVSYHTVCWGIDAWRDVIDVDVDWVIYQQPIRRGSR